MSARNLWIVVLYPYITAKNIIASIIQKNPAIIPNLSFGKKISSSGFVCLICILVLGGWFISFILALFQIIRVQRGFFNYKIFLCQK